MRRIYLDYAASTPVDPEVLKAMAPYFTEKFGNPGSLHWSGQEAMASVDASREALAKALHADFRQVIFVGSATEANNLAIAGTMRAALGAVRNPQIITSAIEHESVMETIRAAEKNGAKVIFLPVDSKGVVDLRKLKESLTEDTVLVSIMYANNEVGTIQPIRKIAEIVREFRAKRRYPLLHTDAAQALQFLDCTADGLGADLITISSHKVYGPKGIGTLYARDIKKLSPVIFGGGQEFGLRSGTENVPAMVGFAKALALTLASREKESERIAAFRDGFWRELKKIVPSAEVNGSENNAEKLPSILNVYSPGRKAEDLLTKFDLNGLAASSGSACRSRALEASYVIEAMGYSKERARSSIRFSFGRPTTQEELDLALSIIKKAVS